MKASFFTLIAVVAPFIAATPVAARSNVKTLSVKRSEFMKSGLVKREDSVTDSVNYILVLFRDNDDTNGVDAYQEEVDAANPAERQARSSPFALRTGAAKTRRHLTDKLGLESTDERDAANFKRMETRLLKITNSSMPALGPDKPIEGQKREVEWHNRDLEKNHNRAYPAANDKVHKKLWRSGTEDGN
ncbi:hypothetical protein CCHL11_10122 [Colletotrichum chlorophyti]|uniref:Uncharacterized protein n=1 Tax=Colletotrichum chlorophyti TaxID=708187 RepID=A0A1Q8RXF7_9PEZI|nr:hypothetical protein CCHL11_10122 [Colletotrichum chlorophyti]